MKTFIDNLLIRKLKAYGNEKEDLALLEACRRAGVLENDQALQMIFGWSSLLEYLDLGLLFANFPKFDDQNQLFTLLTIVLTKGAEQELLMRLYDQVFAECLTQVKDLPQMQSNFLIEQIQEKRLAILSLSVDELFAVTLNHYEKLLRENPHHTIHDLILYLAWDRVCINLAVLFESIPSMPYVDVLKGLTVLKECLIESFQHITGQHRTVPSFFRLVEALYAIQMRQENLQTYTDSEWLTLCQSSRALRPREDLSDVLFIDMALRDEHQLNHIDPVNQVLRFLTLDSFEKVEATLALSRYMLKKLKDEMPEWHYVLYPIQIVCLSERKDDLVVAAIIQN